MAHELINDGERILVCDTVDIAHADAAASCARDFDQGASEQPDLASSSHLTASNSSALPLLRFHRLPSGDAAVIAPASANQLAARRDGRPLLGNLTIISWGSGALLRAGGRRIEVRWCTEPTRRPATSADRCRLCFGSCVSGEPLGVCGCEAVFHQTCDDVRINCPACGAAPERRS